MELATRAWGNGPKTALLVHGLTSSSAGWWRLGPALSELGYRVTAPDLRGHGATGRADSYTFEAYASDLVELGGPWDVMIGHSLGGAAVILAQEAVPTLGAQVVLMDPALWMPSDPEVEAALTSAFRGDVSHQGIMEANPTWHPEDARLKAEALAMTTVDVAARTFRENNPWNVIPQLMSLEVPILVLGADPAAGAIVPRSLGDGLASLRESITYEWVRHACHSLHRDEFEATWSLLKGWLSS